MEIAEQLSKVEATGGYFTEDTKNNLYAMGMTDSDITHAIMSWNSGLSRENLATLAVTDALFGYQFTNQFINEQKTRARGRFTRLPWVCKHKDRLTILKWDAAEQMVKDSLMVHLC